MQLEIRHMTNLNTSGFRKEILVVTNKIISDKLQYVTKYMLYIMQAYGQWQQCNGSCK